MIKKNMTTFNYTKTESHTGILHHIVLSKGNETFSMPVMDMQMLIHNPNRAYLTHFDQYYKDDKRSRFIQYQVTLRASTFFVVIRSMTIKAGSVHTSHHETTTLYSLSQDDFEKLKNTLDIVTGFVSQNLVLDKAETLH